MASKPLVSPVDGQGQSVLVHLPPAISPANELLSSIISLPDSPSIVYAIFKPLAGSSGNTIELARRKVLNLNVTGNFNLLDSLLPVVRIDKDGKSLTVYAIASQSQTSPRRRQLEELQLDGLTSLERSCFTPQDLYPCSAACANLRHPCGNCLTSSPLTRSQGSSSSQESASTRLPRIPLRNIYAGFLDAVRDRLVNDIAIASTSNDNTAGRRVHKFKSGFILRAMGEPPSSDWGASWEHHAKNRPLIYCHLSLHLTTSQIVIHPILQPTCYISLVLPPAQSTPIIPGTPIALIPWAAPAYFVTTYKGPTLALTAQFDASLAGLGVGQWKSDNSSSSKSVTSYIIAWVAVQNKQGEEKGVTIIWPLSLCLAYSPSRSPPSLAYVPTLPVQLQPSPPPPSPPLFTAVIPSISQKMQVLSSSRPTLTRRANTTSTLESFRTLTLTRTGSTGVNDVALEVGAYVDSVAKEREREREKMRKDREVGNSPKLAHAQATASNVTAPLGYSSTGSKPLALSEQEQLSPASGADVSIESYPSPAQTAPASGAEVVDSNTSTMEEPSPAPFYSVEGEIPSGQQPLLPLNSSDPTGVQIYDPFENLAAGWSQEPSDYMDIDYGMGFGMSANSNDGGSGAADRMNTDGFEDGFTFTDDDFSFFDGPSANESRVVSGATMSIPHAAVVTSGLTPAAGPAPFGLSPPIYGDLGSGPGPASATPGRVSSSPWVPTGLADAFSPAMTGPPPDLILSSPGKTVSSHSAPATPNVQLSPMSDCVPRRARVPLWHGIFEPIPFAVSHSISDRKYASGKFSLPSPPDEKDRTNGWEPKYHAATDPRIGVVRKLIGVKRKSFDQGARDVRLLPSWEQEREDWDSDMQGDMVEAKSEDEEDEEPDVDSPMASRPSTPPPAYLPLGPSLLHTQFHHSELLPLSAPLRPPGVAVAAINIAAAAAASMPTPVSPAAALAENTKSLEAAAYILAREVVENSVWASAWGSDATTGNQFTEVWQADVRATVQLLEQCPCLKGPLDLAAVFNLDEKAESSDASCVVNFQQLEAPMLSVGKSDAIIQVMPSALRFWEKLGLGPRGGQKKVAVFAIYEDGGEEKEVLVERWLGDMTKSYAALNLGKHKTPNCGNSPRRGLVPLRFETFRKQFAAFVADLPSPKSSVIFYLLTPTCLMAKGCPALRQLYAAIKRALATYSEAQIIFQFVPETIIMGSMDNSSSYNRDLESLCHSLYERALQPVDRSMSRRFFDHGERVRNYFQDPAFTIARTAPGRVKFLCQAPLKSLDVVDRYTLLHVGYRLSSCGKWIIAACVDQRGEVHDFGLWLIHSESVDSQVVTQVWDFALKFAKRANVEWRIVLAKLGPVGEGELDTWISHLSTAISSNELPMIHVSIMVVEQDTPLTFITPRVIKEPIKSEPGKDPPNSAFVDATFATYAAFPSTPIPLSTFSSDGYTHQLPFVPDADGLPSSTNLPIIPLSTTSLIRTCADPSNTPISILNIHLLHTIKSPDSSLTILDWETHKEITQNYSELAVLGAARWKLKANPILPLHLGALDVMHSALMRGDLN